ncbi:hypothetical protein PTTG_29995, partial [Puccinia triticina 1-1 BBBD Race 1]
KLVGVGFVVYGRPTIPDPGSFVQDAKSAEQSNRFVQESNNLVANDLKIQPPISPPNSDRLAVRLGSDHSLGLVVPIEDEERPGGSGNPTSHHWDREDDQNPYSFLSDEDKIQNGEPDALPEDISLSTLAWEQKYSTLFGEPGSQGATNSGIVVRGEEMGTFQLAEMLDISDTVRRAKEIISA